jgi:hypothetical protein
MIQFQLRRRTAVLGVAVFAAFALMATVAFVRTADADHRFDDIASGTFFHESTGAIFDAGCADGFIDGSFRPKDSATRGQFSYWMSNCASRAAFNSGSPTVVNDPVPNSSAFGPDVTVATVSLDVGATTDVNRNQFVTLFGTANISSDQPESTFCPLFVGCEVVLSLVEDATLLAESSVRLVNDYGGLSMSTNVTVPATLGTHTYTLKMKTRGGVNLDSKNQRLSAVTSTFGSTGGATVSSGG